MCSIISAITYFLCKTCHFLISLKNPYNYNYQEKLDIMLECWPDQESGGKTINNFERFLSKLLIRSEPWQCYTGCIISGWISYIIIGLGSA